MLPYILMYFSNAAHIVPEYSPFHFYAATKHAVKALTEGLRQELRNISSPIKVTVREVLYISRVLLLRRLIYIWLWNGFFQSVSPGIVKTPIVKTCLGDEIDKIVYEKNPYLYTEDIATAVEYILKTPFHVQVILNYSVKYPQLI